MPTFSRRFLLLLVILSANSWCFCGFEGRIPKSQRLQRAVPDFWAESEDVFEVAASATIVFTGSFYLWKNLQFEPQEVQMKRAVKEFLQPFHAASDHEIVVERDVTKMLRQHFAEWKGHATIVSGRRGSGKTWALQEALKNARGVAVFSLSRAQLPGEAIAAEFGLDFLALKEVLKQVKMELSTDDLLGVPVIVLEVQHATRDLVEGLHSFAKALSSDQRLAHVVVCDSGIVAPLFTLWGQQAAHFWVDQLTLAEAHRFLDKKGSSGDWQRFWAADGSLDCRNMHFSSFFNTRIFHHCCLGREVCQFFPETSPDKCPQTLGYIDGCGLYAADLARNEQPEQVRADRWKIAKGEIARFKEFFPGPVDPVSRLQDESR